MTLIVLIIALGMIVLVGQAFVLPEEARSMARSAPELAHLAAPLLAVSIAGLALIQALLFCLARLVLIAGTGRVFEPATFRWVDAMIVVSGIGLVSAVALFIALSILGAGQPGVALLLIACGVVAAGVGLLLLVLRSLLAEAIRFRTASMAAEAELATVI